LPLLYHEYLLSIHDFSLNREKHNVCCQGESRLGTKELQASLPDEAMDKTPIDWYRAHWPEISTVIDACSQDHH
jgi:hypothetical protein